MTEVAKELKTKCNGIAKEDKEACCAAPGCGQPSGGGYCRPAHKIPGLQLTDLCEEHDAAGAGSHGTGTVSKGCSALGQHGQQKCCAGGGCAFKAEGKVCRAITDDNRHVTQPGSAENDCGKDLSKTEEATVDPSRCASFSGTEPANRAKCCGDASCAYTGGKGACVNTDVDPAKRALQGDKCTDKDRAAEHEATGGESDEPARPPGCGSLATRPECEGETTSGNNCLWTEEYDDDWCAAAPPCARGCHRSHALDTLQY